jgi:hypothetical protein
MGTRRWLTGLAAATFVLIAALATAPLAGLAVGIDAVSGKLVAAAQGGDQEDDGENEEAEDEDDDQEGEAEDEHGEDDEDQKEYTDTFYLDGCEWSSTGGNLFSSLEPGTQQVLQGEEDGESLEVIVTVLDETETVAGIETRVVEERESEGGELVEVSRNFFAVCTQTGSVFYFGEDVDDYEGGEIAGHGGAWRAGEGENRPGLIMPAQPLLGARYHQEIAPEVAMDVTETVAVGVEADVPAGTFDGCIVQMDSNLLDQETGPGDKKVYCPGVGIVQDEDTELVSFGSAEATPAGATPVGA